MINIRYHIVSITAVFLALGIGTALGSTFLDRATVNVLDRNISSAETRIEATNGQNRLLRTQVEAARARDEALVQDTDVGILDGRLTDVPVLVVVSPGVETELVDRLRTTLTQADADLRGTLELGEGLTLADDIDPALAESVGFEDVDEADPDDVRRKVYDRLNAALAAAGAPDRSTPRPDPDGTTTSTTTTSTSASTSTTSTTTTSTSTTSPSTTTAPASGPDEDGSSALPVPDGETPEIVTQLLAADLLRLAPGPGHDAEDPILETTGYRFVFVSPPRSDRADHDVVLGLLAAEPVGRVVNAVVVSSTPEEVDPEVDEEARPSVVATIRESAALASRYSTVDNVETFGGLVATVQTLEVLDTAEAGSWGQGEGATAILPPDP